jgi:hypothetical protein
MCEYHQENKKQLKEGSERMFFQLQWFLFFNEPQKVFIHCGSN